MYVVFSVKYIFVTLVVNVAIKAVLFNFIGGTCSGIGYSNKNWTQWFRDVRPACSWFSLPQPSYLWWGIDIDICLTINALNIKIWDLLILRFSSVILGLHWIWIFCYFNLLILRKCYRKQTLLHIFEVM